MASEAELPPTGKGTAWGGLGQWGRWDPSPSSASLCLSWTRATSTEVPATTAQCGLWFSPGRLAGLSTPVCGSCPHTAVETQLVPVTSGDPGRAALSLVLLLISLCSAQCLWGLGCLCPGGSGIETPGALAHISQPGLPTAASPAAPPPRLCSPGAFLASPHTQQRRLLLLGGRLGSSSAAGRGCASHPVPAWGQLLLQTIGRALGLAWPCRGRPRGLSTVPQGGEMPQPRVTLTGDALGGVRPEHAQRQPSGCKARRAASGERDRGCEELVGAPREGQEPLLRAGNHRLAGWFPGLNLTVQCAKCRAWVGPPQFPWRDASVSLRNRQGGLLGPTTDLRQLSA